MLWRKSRYFDWAWDAGGAFIWCLSQNRFDAFVCDIYDSNYLHRTLVMSWISILSLRFLVFCTCNSVFRTWKSQEKRINIRIMETLFSVRYFIRTTEVRRINNSHTVKRSLTVNNNIYKILGQNSPAGLYMLQKEAQEGSDRSPETKLGK